MSFGLWEVAVVLGGVGMVEARVSLKWLAISRTGPSLVCSPGLFGVGGRAGRLCEFIA